MSTETPDVHGSRGHELGRLIGTLRRDYLTYYHRCRTHLSLDKDSLEPRGVEPPDACVLSSADLCCFGHGLLEDGPRAGKKRRTIRC